MEGIIVLLICIILILLIYIFLFKREILRISKQLSKINNLEKGKKVNVVFINKEVEILGESINDSIDTLNKLREEEKIRNEELKEMIENISHDLRTPLTSILGYVQIIKKNQVLDLEHLNKVEEKAKELKEMLSQFFMLSIINNVNYKMDLKEGYIKEILFNEVISYYDQFKSIGIEPKINLKLKNKTILGDENSLKRVISNLINNSIKHGKKELEINLYEEDNYIILNVINDLKEDVEVDKIFDRFYKGKDKSRSGKNTGLGLPIAKGLIKKMNGDINAYKEENRLRIEIVWTKV
ncbi:HAMP domain-containing histidine kinase [Clostridium sp. LY3-2]|uniref:sensor histidine kinase n=1 Tax=Clostridium sp. LY3-2 TaxID=2942482 RepID=UPI002152087A|nr:HAMP domain-containing sensor histidine kinase [Clostridium sp. LY3-2]MCR6515993.1 HAMP domain-containing histidine kinase [Clostridium sp. LY3-2]